MRSIRSMIGMPVVVENRRLGRVIQIALSDDLTRAEGVWVDAGLRGTRYISTDSVRLIGSVAIGAIMILMVNRKSAENPYIAVIRCRDHASEVVAAEYLRSHVSSAQIKSKSAQEGMIELNYEVRLRDADTEFVNELGEDTSFVNGLAATPGVSSAVLVSYNGDYMG